MKVGPKSFPKVQEKNADAAATAGRADHLLDASQPIMDPAAPLPADLVACVELLYFAYRDFTCDPDAVLAQYGFGRAHHRVLHFVHRNPGLKVAELLDILKITKQSLARVLKILVDEGFIIQRSGNQDRRQRRLFVSAKGTRLTEKLTDIQTQRLHSVFNKLGPGADAMARSFLFAMISEDDRPRVAALLHQAQVPTLLTDDSVAISNASSDKRDQSK